MRERSRQVCRPVVGHNTIHASFMICSYRKRKRTPLRMLHLLLLPLHIDSQEAHLQRTFLLRVADALANAEFFTCVTAGFV
jgi:hypothetical protein